MPVLRRLLSGAAAVVAVWLWAGAAAAQEGSVRDVVVHDPHDRPVGGARVSVGCPGADPVSRTTDEVGRLVVGDHPGCLLTVEAPGFQSWRGAIGVAGKRHVIRLALARVDEQVEVRAPAPGARWAPLASSTLTSEDFARLGWNPALVMAHAKARAGTTLGDDRLYVDGVPARELPPLSTIERLSVNADPFSVLFSETDRNTIEVESAAPERRWWWNGHAIPRLVDTRHPLAPTMRSRQQTFDLSAGGPIARTPLVFSVALAGLRSFEERPVFEAPADPPTRAVSGARGHTLTLGVVGRWRSRVGLRLTMSSARGASEAADAGGFVRADAATSTALESDDLRATLDVEGSAGRFTMGLAAGRTRGAYLAQSAGRGLTVPERVTSGGAPVTSMHQRASAVHWTGTWRTVDKRWLGGLIVATERGAEHLVPNSFGQVSVGSPAHHDAVLRGQAAAVWTRVLGPSRLALRTTDVATFAERQWPLPRGAALRAGLRVDAESRAGFGFSPRVSMRGRLKGLELQSGAGVFRQNWSNDVYMQALRFDPRGPARIMSDVGAADSWDPGAGDRVYSIIGPGFTRPLAFVTRHQLGLTRGPHAAGVEYTLTAGARRAGSRRTSVPGGWTDVLESNRHLRRHQLHVRAETIVARMAVLGHYEWVTSHDDSDGPFAFAEHQNDLDGEWARSGGVPPHSASAVLTLPVLRGVGAGVTVIVRSRSPLDLRSGRDADGTRLFLDRGGRERNDGWRPPFRTLDAYAHRRVALPRVRWARIPRALDVTVTGENLLGWRNDSEVGAVLGSPFFGVPLAAHPGRAIRVSVRLAR